MFSQGAAKDSDLGPCKCYAPPGEERHEADFRRANPTGLRADGWQFGHGLNMLFIWTIKFQIQAYPVASLKTTDNTGFIWLHDGSSYLFFHRGRELELMIPLYWSAVGVVDSLNIYCSPPQGKITG